MLLLLKVVAQDLHQQLLLCLPSLSTVTANQARVLLQSFLQIQTDTTHMHAHERTHVCVHIRMYLHACTRNTLHTYTTVEWKFGCIGV